MRTVLLVIWATVLWHSGCLRWAKSRLRRNGAVVALTFHRVLNKKERADTCSVDGIVVNQATFDRLCSYVSKACAPVDAATVQPSESNEKLRVAFTFDDGWRDNYTTALPILQKHKIPATIFVCPGLAGRELPFWPERMVKLLKSQPQRLPGAEIAATIEKWKHRSNEDREEFLESLRSNATNKGTQASMENPAGETDQLFTWNQTSELVKAGIRIGSHTQRHEILTMVSASEADAEIRQSKTAIENKTGTECGLFAYPNGDWSWETRELLTRAGYQRAFTTKIAPWTQQSDPLAIPRVNIYEGKLRGLSGDFSPAVFEYTVFWKAWRAMKDTSKGTPQPSMSAGAETQQVEQA